MLKIKDFYDKMANKRGWVDMLIKDRENLGYNNLIFLNNHDVKAIVDAVEGIVVYLNELRLENKEKFISWRYPKIPSTNTVHLDGQYGIKSLMQLEFNNYGNEKLTLQNNFLDLTARFELGKDFPIGWVAEFKDVKSTGGIESIKYANNIQNSYLGDIVTCKFINDIYYELWTSQRAGGQNYYKLENGNKVEFYANASKIFRKTLDEALKKLGIIREEKRFDISALELMSIDKNIIDRNIKRYQQERKSIN